MKRKVKLFHISRERKKNLQGYLWVAPAFVIVCVATFFPLFFSIDRSLYESNVFTKLKFIGFGQYVKLFQEERFWLNVFNSLFFTIIGIAIALVVGFAIAMMIRRPSKLNTVYRTIILIPWVTNEVVLALMWTWLLNPQMSIVYFWTSVLGINLPNFFLGKFGPLVTVTILNAWRSMGFSLVMILAGLASIPRELEEASLVDGCSGIQKIRFVIIPLIRPVVMVMVIVLTMSFFNIVSFILSMTGGGPLYVTELMSVRLYKETFSFFNIGLSSALTTIMLIMNLIFAFVYKKLVSDEDYY